LNHAAIDSGIPRESATQRLGIIHPSFDLLLFLLRSLDPCSAVTIQCEPEDRLTASQIQASRTQMSLRSPAQAGRVVPH
jgi:hypothetical protein